MSKDGGSSRVKPKVCFMDLESTALEADVGYLVGGGFMDESGRFKWFYSEIPSREKETLSSIIEYMSKHHIVFTWNGSRFDIPFLTARAVKYNLRAELIYKPTHFDLAEFIRSNFRFSLTSLYHVARFFNIVKDVDVEGIDVPSLYLRALRNDRRASVKIRKHCRDDLEVLRTIYLKILPILREVKPELAL